MAFRNSSPFPLLCCELLAFAPQGLRSGNPAGQHLSKREGFALRFVLGIIKPKIYLPYHMDSREMDHVIAHEQTHIRRKDHWWKPLGFLLLTIHWFNPLMWLSYILLCRDIELACDEKVIREMGNEQRADYTQALVACSVNRRVIAACPLAFGEVGVKERVKSVMNYKKPAFWIVLASVIVCAAAAVCFLTNPKSEGSNDITDCWRPAPRGAISLVMMRISLWMHLSPSRTISPLSERSSKTHKHRFLYSIPCTGNCRMGRILWLHPGDGTGGRIGKISSVYRVSPCG